MSRPGRARPGASRREVLLASSAGGLACLVGCAPDRRRPVRAAPPDASARLGMNLHLERFEEPDLMLQTAQARAMGFHHVRGLVLPWGHIEAPRGRWKWDAIDRQVRAAQRAGVELLGCFGPSAAWASRADPKRVSAPWAWSNYPPDELDAWSAYVEKVVARYRDGISTWSPFNEPDNLDLYYPAPVPGQARDAAFIEQRRRSFLDLQRATRAAARRADPRCTILSGAFSVGGNVDRGFVPWLLDHGYGELCEALDVHAYWSVRNIRRAVSWARALLAHHGLDKPVWMTEIGAAVCSSGAPGGGGFSHQQVALFAPKALATALALGVERAYWYEGGPPWPRPLEYAQPDYSAVVTDGPTPVAWSLGSIVSVLNTATSAAPVTFAARSGRADGYVFLVAGGEAVVAWASSPDGLDNRRSRSEGILSWAGGEVDMVLSERPTVLVSRV